jgi:hypothetical protein
MPEKSRNWVAVLNTLHQSDRLNRVSEGAELLYRRLLEVVDNGGNYFADPSLLLGYIFAHRMSSGLTPKDMMDRMQELVRVGLLEVYQDGKLLHISRYYTRLRSDGHGADIRFASFSGKPRPIPDSDRTPPGIHPASTESEIDSESEESQKRDRTSAPASPDAGDAQDGKPEPKPRALNAQAQAVKDCLDFYVACRSAIGQPYPGTPPPGAVIKWLGTQPIREGAVKLFGQCCELAVKASKLDKVYHPFPMTVPQFCQAIPKLNGAWLDGAKANAAKPQRADPRQQALLGRRLPRG